MRFEKNRNITARPVRTSRLVAVGVVFLLISVLYIVQMLLIRVSGDGTEIYTVYNGGITKTTVTVDAVRGDIYDRNGVLLVTSRISHDMAFTYEAIPDTSEDFNVTIARTAEALRKNGVETTEMQFPLFGSYPDYGYYAEATDEGSVYYEGLRTVLEALGLEKDATCKELVSAMISRYKLKRSGLSDAELDDVVRIRYDMLRRGFGVYMPYVLAEDVEDSLMTYVEELDIRGAVFTDVIERVYCYPGYASHILGEVGKIPEDQLADYTAQGYPMDAVVGISGCEAAYEQYLHGIDGSMIREYDEDGNLINYYYDTMPTAGKDVYLTIDIKVQIAAEDALKKNIEDIAICNLTSKDVVRHPLVQKIVKAYEDYERRSDRTKDKRRK